MKDHRLIDERSLAFHQLIANKLLADPAFVEHARRNLERWLTTCAPQLRPALLEWQALLAGPLPLVVAQLCDRSEHATELRQSSPFAGILSTAERTRIIREFQQRESVAA